MNKQEQQRILERYFRNLDNEGKVQAFLYVMLQGKGLVEQMASEFNAMYSFNKRVSEGDIQ
jgi:hypothetical protein